MDIQLPITLRTNRWKVLCLLVGSLAFVAGGLWIIRREPVAGYSAVAFFGLGVLVFTLQLFPNSSYLELSTDGCLTCALFRRSRIVPWSAIELFGVSEIGGRVKSVVLKLVDSYRSRHPKAQSVVNAMTGGWDGALPDTYGMKAEDLAAMLNSLREKYSGAGEVAAPG